MRSAERALPATAARCARPGSQTDGAEEGTGVSDSEEIEDRAELAIASLLRLKQVPEFMESVQVARGKVSPEDETIAMLAELARPFHLPVFILAEEIDFAAPLGIGPLHKKFPQHKAGIQIVPLALITGL